MKGAIKNILLSFSSLAFCFLLLEVSVRLLSKNSKETQWNDRPRFYYLPSGARSLRVAKIESEKDANAFRIAVIGDSFSFAPYMQFDDAFPKKLERMLNLEGKRKVEIINLGVPGYSSSHEVRDLRKFVKKEKVDLIILQMTLNDLEVKVMQPKGITTLLNPYQRFNSESWTNPLLKNLKSIGFIASKIHNQLAADAYKNYYFDLYNNEHAMALFKKSIGKISLISKSVKTPVVAVVFPLFGYSLDTNYPFQKMHTIIHQTLESEGISYLDLFDTYKGSSFERLTVLPGEDFHPNEIAHRMAAEEIYRWLAKNKWIPDEIIIKLLFEDRVQIDMNKASKIEYLEP